MMLHRRQHTTPATADRVTCATGPKATATIDKLLPDPYMYEGRFQHGPSFLQPSWLSFCPLNTLACE